MNLDHIVDSTEVLETTADIITSYVGRNKVSVDALCETISNVYQSLQQLDRGGRALTYKELLNGGVDAVTS